MNAQVAMRTLAMSGGNACMKTCVMQRACAACARASFAVTRPACTVVNPATPGTPNTPATPHPPGTPATPVASFRPLAVPVFACVALRRARRWTAPVERTTEARNTSTNAHSRSSSRPVHTMTRDNSLFLMILLGLVWLPVCNNRGEQKENTGKIWGLRRSHLI